MRIARPEGAASLTCVAAENRSAHVVSIFDAFFDRDGDKLYIGE
jgi:hypothetical protein